MSSMCKFRRFAKFTFLLPKCEGWWHLWMITDEHLKTNLGMKTTNKVNIICLLSPYFDCFKPYFILIV